MPRVTTANCWVEWPEESEQRGYALQLKYDINVQTDGTFCTTLKVEDVAKMKELGARMGRNRAGRDGYFEADTMDELKAKIRAVAEECVSVELTEQKDVIAYVIRTSCSYQLDAGVPVPNGYYVKDRTNEWKTGTTGHQHHGEKSFELAVLAVPMVRRQYKFRSGREMTKWERWKDEELGNNAPEPDSPRYWMNSLDDFGAGSTPDNPERSNWSIIEYTEEHAKFFVNVLRAMCMLNENIKDKLTPDAIRVLAAGGGNLLTA